MEIKKSLLQALVVGLTVGGASSCSMFDQIDEDTQTPVELLKCEIDKHNGKGNSDWSNCAVCGMG